MKANKGKILAPVCSLLLCFTSLNFLHSFTPTTTTAAAAAAAAAAVAVAVVAANCARMAY